jgi:hypothetical protein
MHAANLPWLLANGLHAASGAKSDPNFVAIGNPDLIGKRFHRIIPMPPGGTPADYVPFYFTPKSPMLFTDRHAYTATANWSANPDDLAAMIDWEILCRHDFARSDRYPDKMERYQAEALAYRHVPPAALLGVGCASAHGKAKVAAQLQAAGLTLKAVVRPEWFF